MIVLKCWIINQEQKRWVNNKVLFVCRYPIGLYINSNKKNKNSWKKQQKRQAGSYSYKSKQ